MNGGYKYLVDGEPAEIVETFEINRRSGDRIETSSQRVAKSFGTKISVHSIQNGSEFQRVEVRMVNEHIPELAEVVAVYEFSDRNIVFSRQINNAAVNDELVNPPKDYLVFPLMRCFQGAVILDVAKNETPTNVLVPNIEEPGDVNTLLAPTFDQRNARFLSSETIEIDGQAVKADEYSYLSKHYADDSRFWIDADGMLVKYVFHQPNGQSWCVELFRE